MISQISFRRMLLLGIGLITTVAAILAILVIPPSTIPEIAKIPIWVNVIVQLLIVVVLIWMIKVNNRGGKINKELLVAAGVITMALSLLLLDGAFAYLGNPDQPGVSFWMFICVGCDFVAGLLALIARYFRKK
jgi:hypothetical protein